MERRLRAVSVPAAADGRPNRIINRQGIFGGLYGTFPEYFKFPFPQEAPVAKKLIGAQSVYPFNGGGDWICKQPRHWMFDGTSMKAEDRIAGLVGWEHHGDPADIAGLEVVAAGEVLSGGARPSSYTATIYPGPKGNVVFNAATIWCAGPGDATRTYPAVVAFRAPQGPDARVQRITSNPSKRALRTVAVFRFLRRLERKKRAAPARLLGPRGRRAAGLVGPPHNGRGLVYLRECPKSRKRPR